MAEVSNFAECDNVQYYGADGDFEDDVSAQLHSEIEAASQRTPRNQSAYDSDLTIVSAPEQTASKSPDHIPVNKQHAAQDTVMVDEDEDPADGGSQEQGDDDNDNEELSSDCENGNGNLADVSDAATEDEQKRRISAAGETIGINDGDENSVPRCKHPIALSPSTRLSKSRRLRGRRLGRLPAKEEIHPQENPTQRKIRLWKKLHEKSVTLKPNDKLAAHRYWIGVINLSVTQPQKERDFLWFKGHRRNTVETIWHKYKDATAESDFRLMQAHEFPDFKTTMEEWDRYNDHHVIFRAVARDSVHDKGHSQTESIEID
ncbi:hypothetical protein H2203_007163 [Taxawa tesnikishii (nom. ined.)]|nr:hypothetical protein H2203_007163 [Dothideales sp. JES 119]